MRVRLVSVTVAATLLMAWAASLAHGRRLSVSSQGFRAVWSQFMIGIGESETLAQCPLTLEGSFHSTTMAKAEGALISHVSRAFVGAPAECEFGTMTVLSATLPWHMRYTSFTGTLPFISSLKFNLTGAAFRIGSLGFFCLARTSAERPASVSTAVGGTGTLFNIAFSIIPRIPMTGAGGFGCPGSSGYFGGTGLIETLDSIFEIQVKLI